MFSKGLSKNSKLDYLGLSQNNIGDIGVTFLLQTFEKNTKLTSLDLQRNKIEHEGAKAIATFLEGNSTLKHIYLSENKIGNLGAIALSEGLKKNSTLKYLDINKCEVSYEGVIALAKMLARNNTLEHCKLDWDNYVDNVTASKALGEACLLSHHIMKGGSYCRYSDYDRLNQVLESALKQDSEKVYHVLFEKCQTVNPDYDRRPKLLLEKVIKYRKISLLLKFQKKSKILPKEMVIFVMSYLI